MTMGYDIYPVLTLSMNVPTDDIRAKMMFGAVIEYFEQKFEITFTQITEQVQPSKYSGDEIRWPNMEQDLRSISTIFPLVLFKLVYEWEDHVAWCSWAFAGKYYEESQEEFDPEFEPENLQ